MRPLRLGDVDYEQLIHDALKTQLVTDSVERFPYGMVVTSFSQKVSSSLTVRFMVQVLYGPLLVVSNTTTSRFGIAPLADRMNKSVALFRPDVDDDEWPFSCHWFPIKAAMPESLGE